MADRAFRDAQEKYHLIAIPGHAGIENADDLEVLAGRPQVLRPDDRVLRGAHRCHVLPPGVGGPYSVARLSPVVTAVPCLAKALEATLG
jgi:hypothetical protein